MKTTIFQCTKKYGSPTRATRLKVASNMADPISIKDPDSRLNISNLIIYRNLYHRQKHSFGDILWKVDENGIFVIDSVCLFIFKLDAINR